MKLLLLAVAILAQVVNAQVASIIPATNRYDWVPGVTVGVPGGLPTGRTIFTNLPAGSSSATIQSWINACPSNQIVKLAAGTYTLISQINMKAGVTLKGATNNGTVLLTAGIMNISGSSSMSVPSTNLYYPSLTRGASNIALIAGGPTVAVGNQILIIQDNDTNRVQIYSGATNKAIVDSRKVMEVSGTNITVWPPLSLTFDAVFNPLYRVDSGTRIEYAGFEDLVIQPSVVVSYPILMSFARYCWVSNVVVSTNAAQCVEAYATLQSEFRRNTFRKAAPGGDGYGDNLDLNTQTWEGNSMPLIEDNIFDGLYHGIISSAAVAPVISYNFFTNSHAQSGVTFPTAAINLAHSAGGRFALLEGNWGDTYFTTDIIHGNTTDTTLWRNRFVGSASAATYTNSHMSMLWLGKGSYWYSAVGNILGASFWSAPGANRVYKYTGATWDAASSTDNGGILFLGYAGFGVTQEAKVASTFIGYQNYDFYHSAIYDETVIGGSPTVDNSLIYGSKPSWFGDLTWPPISPSSQNITAAAIPAGYRYINGETPPTPASTNYVTASISGKLTAKGKLTARSKVSVSSTCDLVINQSTQNDYNESVSGAALTQRIRNSDLAGEGVCQIDLLLAYQGADATAYVELRSAVDGTGTLYGTSANTVLVTAAGYTAPVFATFTFSSPISPGTDFYIVLKSDLNCQWRMSTSNQYADATYSAGSFSADRTPWDYAFKIYTQ